MEDNYAICKLKTEYREGFNNADVERAVSMFDEGLICMLEGDASFFGPAAKDLLRQHLRSVFAEYEPHVDVIIADLGIRGDTAYDWGWYQLTLRSKRSGERISRRQRYYENWRRFPDGNWRIWMYIQAAEFAPRMLPEEEKLAAQVAVMNRFSASA